MIFEVWRGPCEHQKLDFVGGIDDVYSGFTVEDNPMGGLVVDEIMPSLVWISAIGLLSVGVERHIEFFRKNVTFEFYFHRSHCWVT
jgi:hypothetical protein